MIDTGEQKKVHYRLRRVGRPATKSSVKDIMKLKVDITRFGRHSGNDYYLDSSRLECFISRWHAEIHRISQNGKHHYILRDNSLNGTYVNNYRVLGNHRLKNGDIICFGHTNGKNLKPGDYAPQTDSEFEFIFEEYTLDESEDNGHMLQPENQVCHPAVDSTTDSHSSSANQGSRTQFNAESSASVLATCTYSSAGIKSESVTSPSTVKSPHASSTSSPVLQDVSNKSTGTGVTIFIPLDQYASQPGTGDQSGASCNISVHVKQEVKNSVADQHPLSTVTPDIKVSTEESLAAEKSFTPLSNKESVIQSKSNQPSKSSGKKRRASHTSSTGSTKKRSRGNFPKEKKAKSSVLEYGDDDGDDDDDDEDGGESEDSSWHYDGEKCDAPNCKRPKTKKVSWVQCDDCDDWYHTQCAGCRYDKVKQANAEFHCGCLEKS